MKVWGWSVCTEKGFDLASDGEVPTIKPDATFHSALSDTFCRRMGFGFLEIQHII